MKGSGKINTASKLIRVMRLAALLAGGFLITLIYFMILPFLQSIVHPPQEQLQVRSIGVAEEAPPPPSSTIEEEKPEEPKKPELVQPDEPLDLSQIELALDPGDGDWGGDFAMNINLDRHLARAGREGAVFSVDELDQKPRAIYQPAPSYPPDLQQKGIEGTVYVIFIIDPNGRVTKAEVQKSTNQAFERPALLAVSKWKFDPGKRGGKPVPFRMRVPITFSMG